MTPRLLHFAVAALVLLIPGTALQAGAPAPAAAALIARLELQAAGTPLSEQPGWAPKRVLVTLLPFMGATGEAYEQALQAAAGDKIELIIDRSGRIAPTRDALSGVDGLIGLCMPAVIANADSTLRWLHSYSVGVDQCSGFSAAQLDSVTVTNNQRLSAPAIAEHTIAMLLALTHNLPAYHRAQAQGQWQRDAAGGVTFGELPGKTMLVVGLGGIGTEIARRAHGLGMRVIATRNSSREGPAFVDYVGRANELHTLAATADVVANALPLTTETEGLFDADFFKALKPNAIFLSVGRGRSTVTADLVAALESKRLSGAGLDVTDPEPLPAGHPLWRMDNVVITPHVAAAGPDTAQRTMIIAVENLRRYVAGEALLNVVDLQRGY